MIRKIMQLISNYPLVSARTEEQFYEDMEAFVVHGANTTVNEKNQLRIEINNTVDDINAAVDSVSNNLNQIAADKVTISQAVANALAARDLAIAANNAAQAIYDNFDDRYLDTHTTAPTVDNDGNALRMGALYLNSTNSKMYVYDATGAKWVDMMYIPTLLSSLSDVVFGSKANNDVIQYDSATGKWVNRSFYSKAELDAFIAGKISKIITPTTNAIPRIKSDGTLENSEITIDDNGNIGIGTQSFNGFGGSGGFKNKFINSSKIVNSRNSTSIDNSYNYDMHYKVGNNWFRPIEGINLRSGKAHTISWDGAATCSYYIGTATSATINAQTFTAIVKGGTITPIITTGQNIWFKFTSDATGSTYLNEQFEEGIIATPFEDRFDGIESVLCQRYLPTVENLSGTTGIATGQCVASTVAFIPILLKVIPRVPPTGISIPSGTYSVANAVGALINVASLAFSTSNLSTVTLLATSSASSLVAGNATNLYVVNAGKILFTGCEL